LVEGVAFQLRCAAVRQSEGDEFGAGDIDFTPKGTCPQTVSVQHNGVWNRRFTIALHGTCAGSGGGGALAHGDLHSLRSRNGDDNPKRNRLANLAKQETI
jgi:hypothetical protein